jgi:branched-chain amino acid transport system substrate-binding protein
MKPGAEMAVADINAAGGLLGRKVELGIYDDACDPKQARAAAEKAASDKIVFMAGHYCSSSSIPASEVYQENGILQITPASTNPRLTDEAAAKGWTTVFRTCGRDDQQAIVAGKMLATKYKGKNIAILHDKTTYGEGLAKEVQKQVKANGQAEKIYDAFGKGDKDFSAIISKLKAANIDVVYVGSYHTETGLLTRQAREQGLKAQIMGGDALVTDEFLQITGKAGEGVMFTFSSDPALRPTAKKVVDAFKAKGINPEGYTLYTYAAVQVWAAAVKKAGTTDYKKVAEAIRSQEWDTVLGKLGFDKKGDITVLDYVWWVFKDGKYVMM